MGNMTNGNGYFRTSHVVLYLEQSDSSSLVVCFGFPLAWVRGPWEPENEDKSVKYSGRGLVLLSLYLGR